MPRKVTVWAPRPIHPVFASEVERAAAQHRLDVRAQDKTPCIDCGGAATVCDVGPPTVWRCQLCADAELARLREQV